jgi:hypothetical protein
MNAISLKGSTVGGGQEFDESRAEVVLTETFYLNVIRPFHHVIVRSMVNAGRRGHGRAARGMIDEPS